MRCSRVSVRVPASSVAALAVLLALAARPAHAAPRPAPATLGADQAVAIVEKLPEVKAWSAYIERTTSGKVHSTMMVEPDEPVSLEGKRYWAVGFFEDRPEYLHRWQTFLVRVDGKEVLVESAATGDAMTLKEWRRKEKPMDRARERKTASLPAPRAGLLAEIERIQRELAGYQDGPIELYERPEYKQALARLWTLVERWAVDFLHNHPTAGGGEIAADLATLAGKTPWFSASAVPLEAEDGTVAVVALDAGFLGGTLFVLSSAQTDRSAALWSVRPLAEKNFALHDELGAWAYPVPGFHDGPLGGRALPLPAARSGRPRFLVDAITHPSMGLDMPGQVSVWEWTGSEAEPEFIQSYWTASAVQSVERVGDLVHIATKEQPKVFFSCGSCDDPKGTWTLRVTPDGVSDLGHAYEEPLLQLADALIARIARREDASSLAAPRVIARIGGLVRRLRADLQAGRANESRQASEPDDPYDGVRSMLGSWRVTGRGRRRILDLATDDWHLELTFEKRADSYYATAVGVL